MFAEQLGLTQAAMLMFCCILTLQHVWRLMRPGDEFEYIRGCAYTWDVPCSTLQSLLLLPPPLLPLTLLLLLVCFADARAALRMMERIQSTVCSQCKVGSGGHTVG